MAGVRSGAAARSSRAISGVRLARKLRARRGPRAARSPRLRRGCGRGAWPSTAATWNLAVRTEMPRARAIALFGAPSTISASTSRSRGLSRGAGRPASGGALAGSRRRPAASRCAADRISSGAASAGSGPAPRRSTGAPFAGAAEWSLITSVRRAAGGGGGQGRMGLERLGQGVAQVGIGEIEGDPEAGARSRSRPHAGALLMRGAPAAARRWSPRPPAGCRRASRRAGRSARSSRCRGGGRARAWSARPRHPMW